MDNVALAIRKSTKQLVKAHQPLPISEQEVWIKLQELELESHFMRIAYRHLVGNVSDLRAFHGCPLEQHKELLFDILKL